jgi:CheY-like chemotaxis protein
MCALVIALIEQQDEAQSIRHCLRGAGHKVLVVEDFKKAKECLRNTKCDLILSDVHLENGGSVFDFLKWIKSKPLLDGIPVVLLSVEPTRMAKYLADGVRLAARVFGAAKYISLEKFDPALLLMELSEFLPESKSAQLDNSTK